MHQLSRISPSSMPARNLARVSALLRRLDGGQARRTAPARAAAREILTICTLAEKTAAQSSEVTE